MMLKGLRIVFLSITTLIVTLISGVPVMAQNTTVTGTVTDTVGTAYAFGTYTVALSNSTSFQPLLGGFPIPSGQLSYSGQLDSTGSFSISLPRNTGTAAITVGGATSTQWVFTFCVNPSQIRTYPAPAANICFTSSQIIGSTTPQALGTINGGTVIPTSGTGSGSSTPIVTGSITTAGANCVVTTSCVSVALPAGTQRAAVTLSGQFAATLAFELSGDSGLTWFQAPSSSSANGTTTISVVADTNVRVRASAFTSGPVTVAIYPSSAGSEVSPTFTGPIAANGATNTSGQDCIYGGGSGFACIGAPLNAGDPIPLLLPNVTAPPNGTFGLVSDGAVAGQNLSWAPVAGLATTPVNSATIASDTFIRANGALGANWTAESDAADTGTLTITSNSVASGTNARAASFWSGAGVFTNDQWSQVTINGAATNSYIGPGVRMSAGGNYFECVSAIGANGPLTLFGIYEVLGGTVPVLLGGGMYGGPVATGAVLKLVAKGNGGPGTANPASLTCFLNGTQVAQIYGITDLPTGSPGIVDDSGNANNMTAWSGGNQASCTKGQWAYDSGFIYVCNATDTWVRTALSTF